MKAAPSLLPNGIPERIEERMGAKDIIAALRHQYLSILSHLGGIESADIARRFLAQVMNPEKEDTGYFEYMDTLNGIAALKCIGGIEAFHTLLSLRTHANLSLRKIIGLEAKTLYALGEPFHAKILKDPNVRKKREQEFDKRFPLL